MGGGIEQGSEYTRYHGCTCQQAHIRDRTQVDEHAEHKPKIIGFMKACDGHTREIFLTSRPANLQTYSTFQGRPLLHKERSKSMVIKYQ